MTTTEVWIIQNNTTDFGIL